MLCDIHPFTLEQTLESLDYLIEEYFANHAMWFSRHDGELFGQEASLVKARNVGLYQFVQLLYPYVYKRTFDLGTSDFHYSTDFEYPHFDEPELLMVAAVQLYSFWISFLGNDFCGNPYSDDKARPINQLAVDAYLRFRIDFGWNGAFHFQNLSPVFLEKYNAHPSFFTYGEMAHITGLSNSTLRGRINKTHTSSTAINVLSREGEVFARTYKSAGKKEILPTGMETTAELAPFFEGKVGGGIKSLFVHKEAVALLSIIGSYQPTQFVAPEDQPFPNYSDSKAIHSAVTRWMKPYTKTARVESLMNAIGVAGLKSHDGSYTFWEYMAKGKARLNFCTLSLINKYMADVEGGIEDDNHWSPLLRACSA